MAGESQVSPVELVYALQGYGTALVSTEQVGDFFPRFTPLALLADELDVRFQPTVKSASSASLRSVVFLSVAHDCESFTEKRIAPFAKGVSE